jgi:hypothetical protein
MLSNLYKRVHSKLICILNVKICCAGSVSVSLTTANWVSNSTIRVGERAMLKVAQKDAYGNPVSSNTVLEVDCFQFSAYVASDSRARVAVSSEKVQYHCDKTSNGYGYVSWYPTTIGKFWLQVGNGATNIRGSPFPVVVESGISNTLKIFSYVFPYFSCF